MVRPTKLLFLCAYLTCVVQSDAAEFSHADVIPEVTSLVFTKDSVALTLEPYFSGGQIGESARTRYFVADRTDYQFRQIPRKEFAEILNTDHYQDHMSLYEHGKFQVIQSEPCRRLENQDSTVRKDIEIDDAVFSVEMLCQSSIADALRLNDEIWIATYRAGGHGSYGSEGLLVTSLGGDSQERIDIGRSAASGIARDPWSTDIWVVTYYRLTVVTEKHAVRNRYWPRHDFDENHQRPDIFVVASMEPQQTNPFAILAYALGEKSYQKFFDAVKDGASLGDKDILYNFHMWGNSYYHSPQLPEELNVLLDVAEPTILWRRFVCMLNSERAKELCGLELDMWPSTSPGVNN